MYSKYWTGSNIPNRHISPAWAYWALQKKVGNDRLIKACQRALGYGAYNYKTIQKILERELDLRDTPDETDQLQMPFHDNIRGENYYQ